MTTPISMTVDIILLMTTLSAVLYCWQLSRRLRALHDLKDGVGAAIVQLGEQIKKSREANDEIAAAAKLAIGELDGAVNAVKGQTQIAEDLLETLDGQIARANGRLNQTLKTAGEVATRLNEASQKSRRELKALTRGVEIAGKLNAMTRSMPLRERVAPPTPVPPTPTPTVSKAAAETEEAGEARAGLTQTQNPFLKAVRTAKAG